MTRVEFNLVCELMYVSNKYGAAYVTYDLDPTEENKQYLEKAEKQYRELCKKLLQAIEK